MMLTMQKSLLAKDTQIDVLVAHNKILDNQMAQMATSLVGKSQG